MESLSHQRLCQRCCILSYLMLIFLKFRFQSFAKADCLCCNHMLQRSALGSRENSLVKIKFICCSLICQNHAASGAPQSLVCRGRHYICVRNGTGMLSCCHKPCNMSHIYHQIGANLICNLTKTFKINRPGISAGSCQNHLRLMLYSKTFYLIIINKSLIIHAVGNNIKIHAREVYRTSMRKMAAMIQTHAQHRISRL